MKFTFKNIGPVKKAELALGNLTIIAGRNNTGKSYIAHTLYIFMARLRWNLVYRGEFFFRRDFRQKNNRTPFSMKEENGKIVVLQKDAEGFINAQLKSLARSFSRVFHMHFATAKEDFDGAAFSYEILEFPTDSRGYKPFLRSEVSDFSLKNGRFEIVLKNGDARKEEMLVVQEIIFFYAARLSIIPSFILPAERMSIPVFYKELDKSRSRYVDEMLQRDSNKIDPKHAERLLHALSGMAARYSRPIRDSINFTRDIEYVQKRRSDFAGSKLLDEIQSVIGGHYLYAKNQILFIPKPNGGGKKAIPLHSASSSVQCFALLYFYLRHTAQKGQLLIIDEPEAHLDTANQIKLARLLARCVNAGLKVLITTHSDYLVKEFNNLIMLSYKPLKHKAELLKQLNYSKGDELKKEDVKAYICEKGGLTPCGIDARGMDMPVFDNTIDDINKASKTITLFLPENA